VVHNSSQYHFNYCDKVDVVLSSKGGVRMPIYYAYGLIFLMVGEVMSGVLLMLIYMLSPSVTDDIKWVMGFVFLIFVLIRKTFKTGAVKP